ncbi:MAG: magnesium transporter [Pseudomonadales bacterium]|nr:magnesium transporter [Pseudomonadales bacterium]
MLNGLKPADIAELIESSPPKSRQVIWNLVEEDYRGDVLAELNEELQGFFLSGMDSEQVVAVTDGLDTDDIADILQQLPDTVIREVLVAMSEQDRHRVERVLAYNEETAGGLMNTDTITVRPRFTLDVVLRYLRRHSELPPMTDSLFVVNRNDQLVGLLPLGKMLTTDPSVTVREVMITDIEPIPASMPDNEVASLFERHDWVSAPVVDEDSKLLGRITIDDVVDVIIEDADHSLMSMAGLDEEEDTFAPVLRTTPRRAIWLGINLLTVFLASAVIKQFQNTIEEIVALAILMPIVPSMGGVAGSQTLTLVIRGMALGQIGKNNARWLMVREILVGMLNGLLFAFLVGLVAWQVFDSPLLGYIIAAAMIINLLTAALAGALLPRMLKHFNIDPALAGGVILTTLTDVVGFLSFLGLATLFYH